MPTTINSSGAICTTGLITAQDLTDIANFYRKTFTVQFSPVSPNALATATDFNNLRNAVLVGAGTRYLVEVPDSVSSENNLITTTTWPAPVTLSFDIPKTATTIGTTVFSGPEGTNLLQVGSANMYFPFKGDTTEAFGGGGSYERVLIKQTGYTTITQWEPDRLAIANGVAWENSIRANPPAGYTNITFEYNSGGSGPQKYNSEGNYVSEYEWTTVYVYGYKWVSGGISYETVQGDTVRVTITTDGKITVLIKYKDSWPGHATDGITIDKSYKNYSDFVKDGKVRVTLHFISKA